ncbi:MULTISPECIES: hypothetical protein [Achromobacter]|uniref:hypothetical protein n=1 Tax=Achromobacter TaxID=222 RepID=UPI0023F738E1|nr:hypothetical protein [Achromobacter anxifer]MDF8363348.1 hypothetical protein [Achromobacter anxifer]
MDKPERGIQFSWARAFALGYLFFVVGICLNGASNVVDAWLLKLFAIAVLLLVASSIYLRSAPLAMILGAGVLTWLSFGGTAAMNDLDPASATAAETSMQRLTLNTAEMISQIPYVATAVLVMGAVVGCLAVAHKLFRKP